MSGGESRQDGPAPRVARVPGPEFDVSVPNVARIYDYLLGGKDNYQADRDAAERLKKIFPDAELACQQNRHFLERVVRFLVSRCGIRQIIDIGTGLPTQGNVHQVAQDVDPATRVVYADYDRVVIRHAEALLARNERVAVVHADLRTPRELITNSDMRTMIDFSQPVAILILATLHFITDDEQPDEILRLLRATMAPGSYLALSHITADDVDPDASKSAQQIYAGASAQAIPRTRQAILRFFGEMELLPPGLVNINAWPGSRVRPAPGHPLLLYGGVARK
jgi:S-adenosyl methyltransferase